MEQTSMNKKYIIRLTSEEREHLEDSDSARQWFRVWKGLFGG
jgi:hypothetical protein